MAEIKLELVVKKIKGKRYYKFSIVEYYSRPNRLSTMVLSINATLIFKRLKVLIFFPKHHLNDFYTVWENKLTDDPYVELV